mmetsp:Transcript_26153/g.56721  ORF Transcript_26153/g.56721 Transcript_26153/m.56721 type:complete len:376 (+) Transcript_26153:429-1556(+)
MSVLSSTIEASQVAVFPSSVLDLAVLFPLAAFALAFAFPNALRFREASASAASLSLASAASGLSWSSAFRLRPRAAFFSPSSCLSCLYGLSCFFDDAFAFALAFAFAVAFGIASAFLTEIVTLVAFTCVAFLDFAGAAVADAVVDETVSIAISAVTEEQAGWADSDDAWAAALSFASAEAWPLALAFDFALDLAILAVLLLPAGVSSSLVMLDLTVAALALTSLFPFLVGSFSSGCLKSEPLSMLGFVSTTASVVAAFPFAFALALLLGFGAFFPESTWSTTAGIARVCGGVWAVPLGTELAASVSLVPVKAGVRSRDGVASVEFPKKFLIPDSGVVVCGGATFSPKTSRIGPKLRRCSGQGPNFLIAAMWASVP